MTHTSTAISDTAPADALATIYKASGDSLRLDIMRVLRRDTFGVLELSQLFDMRQSGMSHHLKVMHKAGLVEPQREGNSIFYRRPLNLTVNTLTGQTIRQISPPLIRCHGTCICRRKSTSFAASGPTSRKCFSPATRRNFASSRS